MGGTSIDQLMEIDGGSQHSLNNGVMESFREEITQQRNINEFVSELNKQNPSRIKEVHEPDIELDDLLDEYEPEQTSNGWWDLVRDPLIILILYFILSQPIVFNSISKVVPQLIPTESGVSNLGILIYGIILAVLFMVVRKLV